MEENNLPDTIQGILDDAASRIRTALDAEAVSEATRGGTKFDAKTADGTSVVIDAQEPRIGTVVGVRGDEWMYKYPTEGAGNRVRLWESWDGTTTTANELADKCRTAHADGHTPILIHRGY